MNVVFQFVVCIFNKNQVIRLNKNYIISPLAEFSLSICSTPKFICTSDDGVNYRSRLLIRLLITENDTSYKRNVYKSRMM